MTTMLNIMTEIEESHGKIVEALMEHYRFSKNYYKGASGKVKICTSPISVRFEGKEIFSNKVLVVKHGKKAIILVLPCLVFKSLPTWLWENDLFSLTLVIGERICEFGNTSRLKDSNFLLLGVEDDEATIITRA